jgi:predicted SAM-dependent methyltransferase
MKLHVGCGSVKLNGFTNIDIRYLPNVDVVDNAAYLRKFKNEIIEEIYACHVLEHFCRWDVDTVLKRWFDLLSPGGKLYISVPDFEAAAIYYNRTKDLKTLIGLLYGGQDYPENYHKVCWDFKSLSEVLSNIGFTVIQKYDWKTSPFNLFDDYSKAYLPHMDFESGLLMSLNVLAIKN